ncbi:MAG: A/G-specific adenine glycosylase [Phenylobacterium sp.]|jgi:A/G-specific adenine glycosylase
MNINTDITDNFSTKIVQWYGQFGRKHLPWQENRTPYRVWISEIMLQQTQVTTVIDYYLRFMDTFPTLEDLAKGDIDKVLHLWTGLGYYARARNLHKAAKIVMEQFDGEFPTTLVEVESLPGIGRSTAGAILSLALDLPLPILDGNVKRVMARCFLVEGWYGQSKVQALLWNIVEQLTPVEAIQPYNQAMMDIGATICTRSKPDCGQCPVAQYCQANLQGKTAEFPHKKPKKAKPVKTEYWPIVVHEGQVLLSQRPPMGLWGGLYSFEAHEDEQSVLDYSVLQSWVVESMESLPEMKHIFTHFQLNIRPILIVLQEHKHRFAIAESDQRLWYNFSKEADFGMPTPVVKLISQINQIKRLNLA